MKKLLVVFMTLVMMMSVAALSVSADNADPWIVFIEAEDLNCDGGNSVSVVDNDKAIGGKALTCTATASGANGDGFSLRFTVPADGVYTVWARVYYPAQVNNSLHYNVDNGTAQVWDWADEDAADSACYGTWHYFYLTFRERVTYDASSPNGGTFTQTQNEWRHSPNYLTLTAGEHVIHFTGRESGWLIDQFVITELKADAYNPNACEGNENYLPTCKFCSDSWKHYVKDVYTVKGVTAEEYFYSTLYPNAQRDTNPDQPVVSEPPVDTSTPETDPPATTPGTTEAPGTTPGTTEAPGTTPEATEPAVTTGATDDADKDNDAILWIVIAAVAVVVVVVVVVIKKKK